MILYKLFKNSRSAIQSYEFYSHIESFISKIIFGLVFALSAILIAFIPGLERTDRHIAVLFFIGGPVSGVMAYYLIYPIENKLRNKKLKQLYESYVVSLTEEEAESIKLFFRKNDIFEKFYGEEKLLESLLQKQIIYKTLIDKIDVYKMERWAFDYFNVNK